MGASGWSYFVPHQPNLDTELQQLKAKVFAEGRYYWVRDDVSASTEAAAGDAGRTVGR